MDRAAFLKSLQQHVGRTSLCVKRIVYAVDDKTQKQEPPHRAGSDTTWLIAGSVGEGKALETAMSSDLKLLPWAAVAVAVSDMLASDGPSDDGSAEPSDGNGAHIASQQKRGKVFVTLPLPVEDTSLPVQVNGMFEIQQNRRGLWSGDDMTGDGKQRKVCCVGAIRVEHHL